MILQLKVTLKDVGVPVSRTIQIEANKSFYDLHRLMQTVFDWTNSHLYDFRVQKTNGKIVERTEISPDNYEDFGSPMNKTAKRYDDRNEILANWLIQAKDKVIYTYDFGDNWEHEILFIKKINKEADVIYPRCIKADNLAPPEDSRGEVIMGEIDLEFSDSKKLVKEINQNIAIWEDFNSNSKLTIDNWADTLLTAKQYHQLKPWKHMSDEDIFAIIDPVSGNYLFCSVIGNAGEMYGLAIYIGMDGFFALIDTLTSTRDEFEILQRQHSLLVSFEDRNDLDKSEYDLIKAYDISFRGKKAWPSFVSFIPGFYPWMMENEEAGTMLLALKETMAIYEEIQNGLQLPDILKEEKILVRAIENGKFQNFVADLDDIFALNSVVDLTISELELKRVSKIKKPIPITIEFILTYVNMPIEAEHGKRPIFPLTVIVADHDEDIVLHHELYEQTMDPSIVQREFINIFHNLNGIPTTILTDARTYYYIGSLTEELNINVEVVEHLPVVDALLAGLQGYLASQ